jgi:hypothetical protein
MVGPPSQNASELQRFTRRTHADTAKPQRAVQLSSPVEKREEKRETQICCTLLEARPQLVSYFKPAA